jgi:hypothetical protein
MPLLACRGVASSQVVKDGHHCDTVLIDCEAHKAVDVLVGRDAEPRTCWSSRHVDQLLLGEAGVHMRETQPGPRGGADGEQQAPASTPPDGLP